MSRFNTGNEQVSAALVGAVAGVLAAVIVTSFFTILLYLTGYL